MLRSAFRFASSARSIGHWLALGWLCAAPVLAGTPEQKLMALRDAAVRNDLPALMELALAPETREKMRAEVERNRAEEVSAETLAYRRQEFDDSFGRLLRPDAVSALMLQARPSLEELRPQLLLGSLAFFAKMGEELRNDAALDDDEKIQLQSLLNAVQLYLGRVDVLDAGRLERALQHLASAARATGISGHDQMRRMQLAELVQRFGAFLPAGKRALAVYELDADGVLRSARFRTLKLEPLRAQVEVQLEFLERPFQFPVELKAVGEDWYLIAEDPEGVSDIDSVEPVPEAAQAAAKDVDAPR